MDSDQPPHGHDKLPVCVDLDGTLARFNKWQGVTHIERPHAGAKHFLETLQEVARIVIHTCRTNPAIQRDCSMDQLKAYVAKWLQDNELPYDEIYCGAGKPIAAAYIDDRAIACDPASNEFAYHRALLEFRDLLREREGRR